MFLGESAYIGKNYGGPVRERRGEGGSRVMMHSGHSLVSSCRPDCGRPRLTISPQARRRWCSASRKLRLGASRVFIRIKITLDGQRGEVTRAQLEISPEFLAIPRCYDVSLINRLSPFRDTAVRPYDFRRGSANFSTNPAVLPSL